jgi:hypothetical protein
MERQKIMAGSMEHSKVADPMADGRQRELGEEGRLEQDIPF